MIKLVLATVTGIYWVWGIPLQEVVDEPGMARQMLACESDTLGRSEPFQAYDCLMIGPPASVMTSCQGSQQAMANEDFPFLKRRYCPFVRLYDLEHLFVPGR